MMLVNAMAMAVSHVFRPQEPLLTAALHNDFVVFWPAGHLAIGRDAARIYDPVWFAAWQSGHIGRGIAANLLYFYPPPNLLICMILAPFNFMDGYLIWSVVLTAIGVIALRRSQVPWPVIGFGLANAAFLLNLLVGQFGFMTGALFIASILAIDRKPRAAGALLGALVIKPQAGLIGPIALLARRRYDGLAIGGIVVGFLCVAVTIICGWAIWPAFVEHGMATARSMLIAPYPNASENFGVSAFWMIRSLRGSVAFAEAGQAICTVGAVVWCWIAWRRVRPDRIALAALTVSLTLLATPYGYTDDMCGFSIMVAWLAWERRQLELADVVMLMWPALCFFVSVGLRLDLTPLVVLLGAMRAWRQLRQSAVFGPAAAAPVPPEARPGGAGGF